MAQVYKITSTKKLEEMEKYLSVQLTMLKNEIEDNGILHRSPSNPQLNCYSSLPIPKDISYFRLEREQVLKRGLQVAGVRGLVSQAEVMRSELESCVTLEYSLESLPLLLHQFYADRSSELALCKHLHMLRWRRFCRHTSIIEQLYPFCKKQVAHLTAEHEDAAHRARRLAPSREKVLTGKGNAMDAVTLEDVVIYLQWLVCHLHSLKTIHSYLQELQYLPAGVLVGQDSSGIHSAGKASTPKESASARHQVSEVPRHTTKLEEFRSQLQELVSCFKIQYNVADLRTSADEMELFSVVRSEFRTIFEKQEVMRTFPAYGGTKALEGQWGRRSAANALKKEANWIPFIRVKPRLDPWQQKLVTKLQQQNYMDELLNAHSRFLQVSDPLKAAEVLKEYVASLADVRPLETSVVTSQSTDENPAHIWMKIYNRANVLQGPRQQKSSASPNSEGKGKELNSTTGGCTIAKEGAYSFVSCMQHLGLLDEEEENGKDPAMFRGAYLSLLYLRHLRIRDLQRTCLGMLNYLRSVERTLAYDTAGLNMEQGLLGSSAEESDWMSAARGGCGTAGGLGSHQYLYNTAADYKVHCAELMEFPELENLHDFYSREDGFVHTQDAQGLYVVYEVALKDLMELENILLLVASHYIRMNRGISSPPWSCDSESDLSWAQVDVDRLAVLLDLWTCERDFLSCKLQLLDCYFEAYQHVIEPKERFDLAQVITDIMHRRPQLDLDNDYFLQSYQAELACLQSHNELIKGILNKQINEQRQYLQRIWRGGQKETWQDFGLPLNYVPKQLVSISNSSPALKSVFLLEFHPSLCLATRVYQTLSQVFSELVHLGGAHTVHEKAALELKLLQLALQKWDTRPCPGMSYSPQIQRDLFSGAYFEDPFLVRNVGLLALESADIEGGKSGTERQCFVLGTFCRLLELVTIRHRLIEASSNTERLSQLYKSFASLMGFEEFHLYVRPVKLDSVVLTEKVEKSAPLLTTVLHEEGSVDRYVPSSLLLGIQELDENHVGKFSFYSEEAVLNLLSGSGIENLQVALACQVAQKNGLFCAVKLASLCHWAHRRVTSQHKVQVAITYATKTEDSGPGRECRNQREKKHISHRPSQTDIAKTGTSESSLLAEAFVSIQLEKAGPRDEMMHSFTRNKQAMGMVMRNTDEVAKVKRRLILEFCQKFGMRVQQSSLRGQIVGVYRSLSALLDDLPAVRHSYFVMGQASELKTEMDSELGLQSNVRTFQARPRRVLSDDGKTLLNLWFVPHFSEVLTMFRCLGESAACEALRLTLELASALHDIVHYLVSFAHLGNLPDISSRRNQLPLAADWGGTEGIGVELSDIQKQVDSLPAPCSPQCVARLLGLRRQVLFLQFDAAVRHCIREALLSSGNETAYQKVNDNMGHALLALSDSTCGSVYSSHLSVPQPLDPRGPQACRMYPWRSFLGRHGLFPVTICDITPIEHCMQLCLSGLSDHCRMVANGEVLGVTLLLEDFLSSRQDVAPFSVQGDGEDDFQQEASSHDTVSHGEEDHDRGALGVSSVPQQDPLQMYTAMKAFLTLWKQMEVFKESWALRRLGVEHVNTITLFKKFSRLYRTEILYPSMRDLAQLQGSKDEYGKLYSEDQPLPPPLGASEVDIKTQQLRRLLESTECDMMGALLQRVDGELTLVISERTRRDTGLPTDLWKRASAKECFSPERPQIVEGFVQRLMEGCEEAEGKLTLTETHLRECLTGLACAVMGRERSNFQAYSLFYEHMLQQQNQMLSQREQDVKEFEELQRRDKCSIDQLTHGAMLEITALRARLAQAEEETAALKQRMGSQMRHEYDSLVRHLFSCCCMLKSRLDEYHMRMDQDMTELVSRVRKEGVENIYKLKQKLGCTKKDEDSRTSMSETAQHQDTWQENRRLAGLLCKLKALHQWRQVASQGRLHRQLNQWQQEVASCRKEGLRAKMMAEEEAALLRQELEAARKALAWSQKEACDATTQLRSLVQQQEDGARREAREARGPRHVNGPRALALERLQQDAGHTERQLEVLSAQLHRSRRAGQQQQLRSDKELRQVRAQLLQERHLKLSAFRRVQELQGLLHDTAATTTRGGPPSGSPKHLAPATCQASCQTRRAIQNMSCSEMGSASGVAEDRFVVVLQRPKTVPVRLRGWATEALTAGLEENTPAELQAQLRLHHNGDSKA